MRLCSCCTKQVYGGHPEICAATEIYQRPVEIWAFDSNVGARILPHGAGAGFTGTPIQVSFFRGGHYDSVISPQYESGLCRQAPGEVEASAISLAQARQPGQYEAAITASRRNMGQLDLDTHCDQIMRQSEDEYLQHRLLMQTLRESERVDMEQAIIETVKNASAQQPAAGAAAAASAASAADAPVDESAFLVSDAAIIRVMEFTGADAAVARMALQAAFGHEERAVSYVLDPSSMPGL